MAAPARRLEPVGDAGDGRPLAARTRDALLAAIRRGTFADGRLPPEDDLSGLLGVSRTTLRAALQALADDGIVSRRPRHGTTVNQHLLRSSMRLNRLVPFTTLVEESGYAASTDPQVVRRVGADAEAAEALGRPPGTPCVVATRLLRADGAPVILVEDTVPADLLVGEEVVAAETTFDFIAANGVAPAEYTSAEVVPRVAAPGRPAGLALAPGTPYVELVEVVHSRAHAPVARSRVAVDDRYVRLSVLRRHG